MAVAAVFKTTTTEESPLSGIITEPAGAAARPNTTAVSDFITVQSFTNFAAIAGAITAAWQALQRVDGRLATLWVPYGFAALFALASLISSWQGLKGPNNQSKPGTLLLATFIAIINALVLASAVVGTDVATGGT
jgi:hypothetical protein